MTSLLAEVSHDEASRERPLLAGKYMTDCTAALSEKKKWKQKIEPGI